MKLKIFNSKSNIKIKTSDGGKYWNCIEDFNIPIFIVNKIIQEIVEKIIENGWYKTIDNKIGVVLTDNRIIDILKNSTNWTQIEKMIQLNYNFTTTDATKVSFVHQNIIKISKNLSNSI